MNYSLFDPATGRVTATCSDLSADHPVGDDVVPGHPPQDGKRYKVDVQTREFVEDAFVPARSHQADRLDAYPSVGNQLDALWKIAEALATRQEIPREALAVLATVKAVKLLYPKPEGEA